MITIAATVGDPTSIGPEVAAQAITTYLTKIKNSRIVLHVDKKHFQESFYSKFRKFEKQERLQFKHINSNAHFSTGKPSDKSGAYALAALDAATRDCLEGRADALVTGPIDKHYVSLSHPGFTGHTEYLQKACKTKSSTMVLKGRTLAVALVTTHIPLKEVPGQLNADKILLTALETYRHFAQMKADPRIAVCALNPHASDKGLFGDEEQKIIQPAVDRLTSMGLNIIGPLSPDTAFHNTKAYDAIVCMYHDQGLIPLKMKHFYDAVNITLGLPFPRVSVDHGTAFDIAGKNKASSISYLKALEYATKWATRIASSQRRHRNHRGERTQS
jgi:4-hydroxythreonine-4-phosphate dehydrogenase